MDADGVDAQAVVADGGDRWAPTADLAAGFGPRSAMVADGTGTGRPKFRALCRVANGQIRGGAGRWDSVEAQRSSEISLPLNFVGELGRAETVEELRDVTSRWLSRIMSVQRGSVGLITPGGGGLQVHALGSQLAIPEHQMMPLENTIVGDVFHSLSPMRIDNLATIERLDAIGLRRAGLTSCLVVPVIGGSECYGTLNLAHTEAAFFTDRDLDHLLAIAGLLGSYLRIHHQFEREQRLASTDDLTGMWNRRAVIDRAEEILAADRGPVCLLFIDVDGFKSVNDAYGHLAGDNVLRAIASRLTGNLRDGDVAGRIGGDEFLVVCSGDITVGERLAERLVEELARPVQIGGGSVVPKLSIGVAVTAAERTVAGLLIEADLAMTEAKRTRTEVVVVDEALRRRAEMIGVIDRDLDPAMRSGEMCFHYQPVRRLDNTEIVGCEALVRWHHPVHGWIPPPLLIERLEATGTLNRFTRWMLEIVTTDWKRLLSERADFGDRSVAVNLTSAQLGWRSYAMGHREVLERSGLGPGCLSIEVVESGGIDVGAAAEDTLQELAAGGVRVALDDFGTGYNALDYFGRFPIHTLKLDRSLISRMLSDETTRAIVTGLVRMADELAIVTLAEGIESDAEVEACRQAGVTLGQGYHLGRPMPLEKLIAAPETLDLPAG